MELFVTVGIVIAFTLPVLFLLLSVTSVGYEDTSKAQAEASARTLADAVNLVYTQGPGAKRLMILNVPSSTEDISISGSEVVIKLNTASGEFEAASPIFAKIYRNEQQLGKHVGLFFVTVQTKSTGEVEVVETFK